MPRLLPLTLILACLTGLLATGASATQLTSELERAMLRGDYERAVTIAEGIAARPGFSGVRSIRDEDDLDAVRASSQGSARAPTSP